MFDLVLQQGRVVTDKDDFIGDIAIKDGKIVAIHKGRSDFQGMKEISCLSKMILPGFIDLHVHFNDPGLTHREDFYTGTAAAAAGGVTLVAEMPLSNNPVSTTLSALEQKKEIARKKAVVDYALWAGLVDDNTDELTEMHKNGAHGFKAFTCFAGDDYPMATEHIVRKGLETARKNNTFVGVHCEDEDCIQSIVASCKSVGESELDTFIKSHAPITETVSVKKMITLAEETEGHLHICHASLPKTIEIVDQAKKDGINVTVETCPQYLLFTEDDLKKIGGPLKCTPPVRDQDSIEKLWQMLEDGKIDLLVSDHSPATVAEKDNNLNFNTIWGGINGVQFLFPLLFTEGVIKRNFPLQKLIKHFASEPAKFMNHYPKRGTIAEGAEANFVIFDSEQQWIITEEAMHTKNKQSPYLNSKVQGMIESTWILGKKIYQHNDNKYSQAAAGTGRFIQR